MRRLKYTGLFGLMILVLGGARVSAKDRPARGNESRGFVFNYRVDVSRVPSPESEVKVWIPLPIEDENQEVLRISYGEHLPPTIVTEPETGLRLPWGAT